MIRRVVTHPAARVWAWTLALVALSMLCVELSSHDAHMVLGVAIGAASMLLLALLYPRQPHNRQE